MNYAFFFVTTTENSMDRSSRPKIMARLRGVGTSTCGMFRLSPTNVPRLLMYSFMASSILMPTNISISPSPYFRYLKYLATAARAK